MNKYLKRSLKRNLNRRVDRLIQRQINHGVDGLINHIMGTPHPRRRHAVQRVQSGTRDHVSLPNQRQTHTPAMIHRHIQMGDDDFDCFDGVGHFDEYDEYDEYDHTLSHTTTDDNAFIQNNTHTSQQGTYMDHQTSSNFGRFNVTNVAKQPKHDTDDSTKDSDAIYTYDKRVHNTSTSKLDEHFPRLIDPAKLAHACYELIDNKANNNAVIQGASGFFGLIATITVDVGVIPLIYATMWNEIRAIYGYDPIDNDDALKVIANIIPEVLSDAIFDKVLGNVPIIGVYFNAICAKQMTWRLGTLFTLLSARGSEVHSIKCKEAMMMIRHMFPQKDMFGFTTPDYGRFIQMVVSIHDTSIDKFNHKVDSALNVFLNV